MANEMPEVGAEVEGPSVLEAQWALALQALVQAEAAAQDPVQAAEFVLCIARIRERQLEDVGGAREAYLRVLDLRPGHPAATEALAQLGGGTAGA